ncbi:MAG: hypothetical protein V3T70_02995 [Phycisphaerae bacterium]
MSPDTLKPGTRVRVEQAIHGGESVGRAVLRTAVEGEVVSCEAEPTASWFAHGKNNLVWLLRLRLKKADGEISVLNLDESSIVTILAPAPAAGTP